MAKIYLEFEDIDNFEQAFLRALKKHQNEWKQQSPSKNEYAKGILVGLKQAEREFICAMNNLRDI